MSYSTPSGAASVHKETVCPKRYLLTDSLYTHYRLALETAVKKTEKGLSYCSVGLTFKMWGDR